MVNSRKKILESNYIASTKVTFVFFMSTILQVNLIDLESKNISCEICGVQKKSNKGFCSIVDRAGPSPPFSGSEVVRAAHGSPTRWEE